MDSDQYVETISVAWIADLTTSSKYKFDSSLLIRDSRDGRHDCRFYNISDI